MKKVFKAKDMSMKKVINSGSLPDELHQQFHQVKNLLIDKLIEVSQESGCENTEILLNALGNIYSTMAANFALDNGKDLKYLDDYIEIIRLNINDAYKKR